MKAQEDTPRQKKRRSLKDRLQLVGAIAILIAATFAIVWRTLGVVDNATIGITVVAALIIIIAYAFRDRVPRLTRFLLSIIGEDPSVLGPRYRFIVPTLFFLPLAFYLLLPGLEEVMPSALRWEILVVAPTLGGLLLAGAGSRKVLMGTYHKMLSVVQKMIVATVSFLLFTSLLFLVDLIGGINTNVWDWSFMGWVRGVSFWGAVTLFYPGVYLFLLALSDLVFVLRHLKR